MSITIQICYGGLRSTRTGNAAYQERTSFSFVEQELFPGCHNECGGNIHKGCLKELEVASISRALPLHYLSQMGTRGYVF
jgi:hypothetical protein